MAAAAAVVAAVYFNNRERVAERQMAALRDNLRTQTVELNRMQDAMAILESANSQEVSFGAGPKGRVFVHPTMGVLLMATNLPPAPAGKAYELWVIPKGGAPAPAGMFQSQPNGSAMFLRPGAVDMSGTAAVAVTMENDAGSNTPTAPILIMAPLAGAPQ
jgi:anti-sigma-K factor RskA